MRKLLVSAALASLAAGSAWAARSQRVPADRARRAVAAAVTYAGCNQVRALGRAPLYHGQPGYRIDMDGDRDGIACEPHRR